MRSLDYQDLVLAFHRKFNLEIGTTPSIRAADWYVSRIREEANETFDAYAKQDFLKVVDGLMDLLYVSFGAAVACGIDVAPLFEEVHRANMEKSIDRDHAGKVSKPPGWIPPRLGRILIDQFTAALESESGGSDESVVK